MAKALFRTAQRQAAVRSSPGSTMALALHAAVAPCASRSGFAQRVQQHVARPKPCGSRSVTSMAGHGTFFVGGNWKCNGTREEVEQLVKDLNAGDVPKDCEVVVSPPFVFLDQVKSSIKPKFQVAAQNCWTGKGGAFTGEVSADMLANLDIPWVILGHSERRALLAESNEVVGTKVGYALSKGLKVIPCVGETLQQRESGEMFNVLDAQLQSIADNVSDWTRVVIAYEPVWAIGTGVVATPAQAEEVHAYIREWVSSHAGPEVAAKLRLLYGGSVNDANCIELAEQADVDGFLVGGASLKGSAFVTICNAYSRSKAARAKAAAA